MEKRFDFRGGHAIIFTVARGIEKTTYSFYVDDGYPGTNFQRPSFQRMIADMVEINRLRKRNAELDQMYIRLYEDYFGGKLSEKKFAGQIDKNIYKWNAIEQTIEGDKRGSARP